VSGTLHWNVHSNVYWNVNVSVILHWNVHSNVNVSRTLHSNVYWNVCCLNSNLHWNVLNVGLVFLHPETKIPSSSTSHLEPHVLPSTYKFMIPISCTFSGQTKSCIISSHSIRTSIILMHRTQHARLQTYP
jgi:hypothetical protein